MVDNSRSADGKRLVGKGELDPAETPDGEIAIKTIKVGQDQTVEVPVKTGEGGGGVGGGSPGELTYPPDPLGDDSPDDQAVLNRP